MKIWLPDDAIPVTIDTSDDEAARCTTYAQRFQMTLQPIKRDRGFELPEKERDE